MLQRIEVSEGAFRLFLLLFWVIFLSSRLVCALLATFRLRLLVTLVRNKLANFRHSLLPVRFLGVLFDHLVYGPLVLLVHLLRGYGTVRVGKVSVFLGRVRLE